MRMIREYGMVQFIHCVQFILKATYGHNFSVMSDSKLIKGILKNHENNRNNICIARLLLANETKTADL